MTELYSPQNDFYQYVNHKWLQDPENQIPDDYSSWGGFTKLHDDITSFQLLLLHSLSSKKTLSSDEEKIKAIWTGSQSLFRSWENGNTDYSPISTEIEKINAFFSKDELYVIRLAKYLYYTQISGIRSVIDLDTGSDLKNVNNVVLDFSVDGLSLPSPEYYYSETFKDKMELYKNHLSNVEKILKENDIKLSDNFVENIILFETTLSRYLMTPAQSREYDGYYTNTKLNDLYTKINELRSLESKKNNYDEKDTEVLLSEKEIKNVEVFFETLYENLDIRKTMSENINKFKDVNPPNVDHITAYDGDAIRRYLRFILDETNHDIHYDYMCYKIISSCRSFCSKELDDEFFHFYQHNLGGQKRQKSQEKRSVEIVNAFAGELLGRLFVEQYFSEDSKSKVKDMILDIINVMNISLQDNNWLTDSTKEKAIKKLSGFKSKIGYPDIWKSYDDFNPVVGDSLYQIKLKAKRWSYQRNFLDKINTVLDRNEWRMNPQTVNAYFMPTQNEIVFPAAILQAPFFHVNVNTIDFDIDEEKTKLDHNFVLMSVNYRGIGAVIAHEITHGYHDKGRKFDNEGNLNDWWCKEDEKLFNSKTQKIVDSVLNYRYVDSDGKEHLMDEKLTMGENLADIGGLSLSLKGLLGQLKDNNVTEETKMLCLRVFFKSWANIWKQNINAEKRLMLLKTDPHGPTDFRGNLVQHMDEFYSSFNITTGDPMYLEPDKRMKMW